ncbi:MAG: hypothetical protein Q4D16_03410 [Eubacteriales bacterium]|nr:hypothetical protein [Eubacteriales bacterium]
MIKSKAIAIIKDIHGVADPEDKLTAIQEIIDMETYNSITKANLIDTLRWMIEEYI